MCTVVRSVISSRVQGKNCPQVKPPPHRRPRMNRAISHASRDIPMPRRTWSAAVHLAVVASTCAYSPGVPQRQRFTVTTAVSATPLRECPSCFMSASLALLVGAEPQETHHGATLVSRFSRLFRGHFDNSGQADADMAAGHGPRAGGGHEHIHCHLQPLQQLRRNPPADGEATRYVLASYYADGQPERLFRERIYALSSCSSDAQFGECIQMQIFRVREQTVEALRAAAGDAGRVSWELDDVADALLIPDCNVYWRWLGERFEGEMRTESIVVASPVLNKDIIVRDDVALWEGRAGGEGDALWCNDRGTDMDGNYVYGNIHDIPYQMQRVASDHWTATGLPRPP